MNITNSNPIRTNNRTLKDVYMKSIVAISRDCAKDTITRISKANQACAMLKSIWGSPGFNVQTKIGIFISNALSVLL